MVDFPHKILVPQRPDYLVTRPHLNERLSAISDRRLIALVAPAGYGKTSLLIDFVNSISSLSVCWYTLDSFDQDPWVFLDYLIAAIEQRFPQSTQQTIALLKNRERIAFAMALATLARDIYTIAADFVIVIDDWHLVDHIPDVGEAITYLLFQCPRCHVILASRNYPSLPNIVLLAARRQMITLDEKLLHFTASEVTHVLNIEHNTTVTIEQAVSLVEQFDGWITGILLSCQAMALALPVQIPSGTSINRQVYQFFAEQVLTRQPADVCRFLLDSALLEELIPERCDAIFKRNDSRRMLEILVHQHLFVTEIKPGVLRYHPLFREFLQEYYRTTDPAEYHGVVVHVADNYAAQGQWLLAFESYISVGARVQAQRVAAKGGEDLYVRGRLETLERWFATLSQEMLNTALLCLKARVSLDRGHINEAQVLADLAQTRAQPSEEPMVMLIQAQLARVGGRYEDALEIARHVLDVTADPAQHASALRTIGICHHRLGQTTIAIEKLNQALALERQRGNLHAIATLQIDLGICHREAGLLQSAEEYYTHAEAYWASVGNTGLRALCLNNKGGVQHLAGRYRDAYATLTTALQNAREAAVPNYLAAALSSLGDLYCDLQLWNRAKETYEEARKHSHSAYLIGTLDLAYVRMLMRQRQYAVAGQMLRELPKATLRRHPHGVMLLQGTIAWGMGDYDQAMSAARQAIADLEQAGALADLARAYLLQAQVAADTSPDSAAIIASLEQACRIADQFSPDAFLAAETLYIQPVLRRASAAGWTRAADWLQRHQDMQLIAQMIDQDDGQQVLTVRTLGQERITLNSQPIEISWSKAREVLYYLLAHTDGATIDVVREAIWPNLAIERSRERLRTAIYHLRTALPKDLIALHGRQLYQLNRDIVRIDYDVERFLQILDTQITDPEAIFEAIDLYHGPYLSSLDNHWSASLRTHLEQHYLRVLHLAAERCKAGRAFADALTFYERILEMDTLDEMAYAGMMDCYMALGNRAAAINQYQTLRRVLDEELGLEPGPSSLAEQLYRRILNES